MDRPPFISIKLSDHKYTTEYGVETESNFHDLEFTDDLEGGNKNQITLTIDNQGGNCLELDVWDDEKNFNIMPVRKVRIKIRGAWEKEEFLRMLEHILNAEKVGPILFRGE